MNTSKVLIETLTVGQMAEHCYLVMDEQSKELFIIDPGDDASYIAEHIEKLQGKPTAVLATHGHFDHVLAANELCLIYAIPFYMKKDDQFLLDRMSDTAKHFLGHGVVEAPPTISKSFFDGETIAFGGNMLEVHDSPGHTPGSVFFYLNSEHTIFAGDTIFENGAVGRTDFSYSEPLKLSESVGKILSYPPETIVLSGHGGMTTVLEEKKYH